MTPDIATLLAVGAALDAQRVPLVRWDGSQRIILGELGHIERFTVYNTPLHWPGGMAVPAKLPNRFEVLAMRIVDRWRA